MADFDGVLRSDGELRLSLTELIEITGVVRSNLMFSGSAVLDMFLLQNGDPGRLSRTGLREVGLCLF